MAEPRTKITREAQKKPESFSGRLKAEPALEASRIEVERQLRIQRRA
jgi:hypothetical protein